MIKVLWLSATPAGYEKEKHGYNGGGWIESLLCILQNIKDLEIGVSFLTPTPKEEKMIGKISYFPIYAPTHNHLQKFYDYYIGYKKQNHLFNACDLFNVINKFNPDIIHLFGMENNMACIIGKTSIPIVVHLQGILSPSSNAFWPVGFNKVDFLWPFSLNEWILRNGYIYAQKSMMVRAKHEKKLMRKLQYAMGRTKWDKLCTAMMAPQACYYHVDEILRSTFYEHQGEWKLKDKTNIQIITTASNTIYKGIDVVLKTAQLLKENYNVPFEWYIAGLRPEDKLIQFFERKLKINSSYVHVHYLGILSAEELCQKELQSSIYVHPTYIDNSPNSLCEAQMLGIPCIATYVGGIPSLIHNGEDGILVPTNAPYEIAHHIINICFNTELATTLSTNGIQNSSARHNKEKITAELLSCYKKIVIQHS